MPDDPTAPPDAGPVSVPDPLPDDEIRFGVGKKGDGPGPDPDDDPTPSGGDEGERTAA